MSTWKPGCHTTEKRWISQARELRSGEDTVLLVDTARNNCEAAGLVKCLEGVLIKISVGIGSNPCPGMDKNIFWNNLSQEPSLSPWPAEIKQVQLAKTKSTGIWTRYIVVALSEFGSGGTKHRRIYYWPLIQPNTSEVMMHNDIAI